MDAKRSIGEPRVIISRDALLHNAALLRRLLYRKDQAMIGDARLPARDWSAENARQLARDASHTISRREKRRRETPWETVGEHFAPPPTVKLCATIKADAYGHGLAPVVDALCNFAVDEFEAPLADMLAVASIAEAQRLPGNTPPVLVLAPIENCYLGRQREQIEAAILAGWTLTICNPAAADDLSRIAVACGKRAAVQVLLDTGMTRSGVAIEALDELLLRIVGHPSLRLTGLFTHFAAAGDPANEFTGHQIERFCQATDSHSRRLGKRVSRHTANSGALFFHPDGWFDMVRPGIALYGIDPSGKPSLERPLRPALKWTAPLIDIKSVKKGATVGYDRTWTAPRDTQIGLIPVGYADGYPRTFTNNGVMLLHARPVPVAGAVSMDSTTLDLGSVPQARVGDEVTLLDSDPLSPASVYRLAERAGTIAYEILCRIGPRIHRVPAESESIAAIEADPELDEVG